MKQRKLILTIAAIFVIAFSACDKVYTGPKSTGVTSLNIVNAIPGTAGLIVNVNKQPYLQGLTSIGYAHYQLYSISGGSTSISFTQSTDTTQTLYSLSSLNLINNSIHSLFLTGTLASPESVLVADNLPDHSPFHGVPDSTIGLRFINLSTGSSPISVNIQGQANGSEVAGLSYKSITEFKNYTATSTVASYSFEFRDAVSGTLITTFTLNGVNTRNVQFKNLSIVFYGPTGSQSAFSMNNF